MKPSTIPVALLAAALAAACGQPEKAAPAATTTAAPATAPATVPDTESSNRIRDLGRDLLSVARGDNGAPKDFVDDLVVVVDPSVIGAQPAVQKFGARIADAVTSVPMTDEAAQQLAQTIGKLVGATSLTDGEVQSLQGELRSQLTSIGIAQDRVNAVVADVPTVQRAVTRPRS